MTISLVSQQDYSQTFGTATQPHVISAVSASVGDVLVAIVRSDASLNGGSITDSGGNTWTNRAGANDGSAGSLTIFTCRVTTALTSGTVSVTYSSGPRNHSVHLSRWSGVTWIGEAAAADRSTTTTPAPVTVNAVATEFVVLGGICAGVDPVTLSSGWTALAGNSVSWNGGTAYQSFVATTTQGPYGPTWTYGSSVGQPLGTIALLGPVSGTAADVLASGSSRQVTPVLFSRTRTPTLDAPFPNYARTMHSLDVLVASSVGPPIAGVGTATAPQLTAAATAALRVSATGAATVPQVAATIAASLRLAATGTASIPGLTSSGVSTLAGHGAGDIVVPLIALSGTGVLPNRSSGSVELPLTQALAETDLVLRAAGDVAILGLQVAGIAGIGSVGLVSITLPLLTPDGTGTLSTHAQGLAVVSLLDISGIGQAPAQATGSASLLLPQAGGTGAARLAAAGTASLPPLGSSGLSVVLLTAQGLVLPLVVVAAVGSIPPRDFDFTAVLLPSGWGASMGDPSGLSALLLQPGWTTILGG